MNKLNSLNQVSEFHETFGVPILDTPSIPPEDRCSLRINLIKEELDELIQSIKDKDMIEISDALADLQYVLSGTIIEFGLGNIFEKIFDEVHNSNMSKSCNSFEEAMKTISYYKEKDGTESYSKEMGNKWVVYRKSDNKVLKSIEYKPVDLKKFL